MLNALIGSVISTCNLLRPPALQIFFDAMQHAFARSNTGDAERTLADRIFKRLEIPGEPASPEPVQLPVCEHLAPALNHVREQGGSTEALADALGCIAPRLVWARRTSGRNDDPAFKARHANAEIVGKDGLEIRHDIRIGVSLLAPHTQYPDHRHPPEEIYIALSPGEWRSERAPWHSPGIGGLVHNAPDITHAMRSQTLTLLAVWCLWTE